jgi:hypothetical protein
MTRYRREEQGCLGFHFGRDFNFNFLQLTVNLNFLAGMIPDIR